MIFYLSLCRKLKIHKTQLFQLYPRPIGTRRFSCFPLHDASKHYDAVRLTQELSYNQISSSPVCMDSKSQIRLAAHFLVGEASYWFTHDGLLNMGLQKLNAEFLHFSLLWHFFFSADWCWKKSQIYRDNKSHWGDYNALFHGPGWLARQSTESCSGSLRRGSCRTVAHKEVKRGTAGRLKVRHSVTQRFSEWASS